MPNPFFSFKQFTVYHDRCAMKVGTDGVLLGAWTDLSQSHHILDIGTGTGLIALMMAQRSPEAQITAIDLDAEAVSQAQENIQNSPWKDRVEAVLQNVCTYSSDEKFDTIVSNPPYFIDSLKCPDNQRNTARHTDTLDAQRLLEKVAELLTPEGRFSIILPADQTDDLFRIAEAQGLHPTRWTKVITRPGLPPKRSLIEFQKKALPIQTNELVIELERHMYSKEYIEITREYYLKL